MNSFTIAQAGGVAPLSTDPDKRLDQVSARHFSHPALGERVVTRLVPDTLGQAEELSMEFHGFASQGPPVPVGRQLRKGLGFPAWALVNDPARGSLALEVVKEFRAQARLARSRPGAAKDGFGAIGDRLGASVPHFVPSFYEEAGRAFLEHGNAGMATQMFTKAREAEKVHALSVDETLRRESFLEFALAGAISVKALTTYAQDLSKERDPQEAYQQYRELCLRRTLGGMPPWAAMLKDLKRLAKAAGQDVGTEEKGFVSEVLSSASLTRAPIEFWSTAKASIAGLCRENPALGVVLLKLRPVFSGDSLKHGQTWLELLEAWALTRHLTEPGDKALAPGEAAAWLSQMMGLFSGYSTAPNPDALFDLTRRMAERLRSEGQPVVMRTGWRQLDLDLAEELTGLGIPIRLESQHLYPVDLPSWASYEGAERRRDLVHIAHHPAIEPILRLSLDRHAGNAKFQAVTAGKPGWTALRRRWLEHQLDRLERGGIPGLRSLVETWEAFQWPRMLGPYPDLRERLGRLPLATLATRTLRAFVAQELTWPALEAAIAELSPDGKASLNYDGRYPYLVVYTETRAIAVGPDGISGRYDLRVPQGARLNAVLFIGGQFLVVYYHNYEQHAIWSGGNPCQLKGYHSGSAREPSTVLPEVGLTYGGRAVQGGDAEIPDSRGRLFCDGETCWYQDWSQGEFKLREFDPRTGKEGRYSLPTFLEEFAQPEATLVLNACALLPLPDRSEIWGWRLRRRENNLLEGQSQDGWSFKTELQDNFWPSGSFATPGGRIVIFARSGYQQIVEPDSGVVCAEGLAADTNWPLLSLAPHWWTLFHARHEGDSMTLRQIDEKTTAMWLESDQQISLSDAVLRQGVADSLKAARELSARLGKFAAELDAAEGDAPIPATALGGILQTFWLHAEASHDLLSEIAALEEMVSRAKGAENQEPTSLWKKVAGLLSRVTTVSSGTPAAATGNIELAQASLVTSFVGRFAALAWRSVAPFTDPQESSAALDLLERWASSPLMEQPENFRRIELKLNETFWERVLCQVQGGHGYLLERQAYGDVPYEGLEYHPKAAFQVPEGTNLVNSVAGPFPWDTAARLKEFVSVARKHGPRPWSPEQTERLSELTGLSHAEASLVCCGLPGLLTYEANFLAPELRESLGLKAADARTARDSLKTLNRKSLLAIYSQAMPDNVECLWSSPELAVERLATAWNRVVGPRLAASEERIKELADLRVSLKPTIMLAALAAPSESPFGRDGRWSIGPNSGLQVTDDAFTEAHLCSLTAYLSYLYEYAPTGDPLRAATARAWPLAMQRLRHPDLTFATTQLYSDQESQLQAWRQLAHTVGFQLNEARWFLQMLYHPARYRPDSDAFRPLQPMLINTGWLPWLVSQTPEFEALVARLTEPGLPSGVYEGNPLVSAPKVVEEVSARLGLSPQASMLYLQTLALARPTSKNVQMWNGWSTSVYKKAADELVDRSLVLEAKRARAGRSHFIPGGWEDLKAPHLPLESWKLPLYQVPVNPPCFLLNRVLALRPVGETFALAWNRVLQGDAPAYDESKAITDPKKGRRK